jgi:hypothetical protein
MSFINNVGRGGVEIQANSPFSTDASEHYHKNLEVLILDAYSTL